ncbi:hypothetical protein GCM10010195_67270 [Kitasatospora griseola]|nr:hypothetical protein GCM10010195_67270 [Kitasatospora griseola]
MGVVDRLDGDPGLDPALAHTRCPEAAGALRSEPNRGAAEVHSGPGIGRVTAPAGGQGEAVGEG